MLRALTRALTPDLAALRESRDFRLLTAGTLVTGLGTQAALVALPYQVYVLTRDPLLVGLLGLVELGPLVTASLVGGALADVHDRRRLLLVYQVALVLAAGALAAVSFLGRPHVGVLYALAALLAGASALERVARAAMVPGLVSPGELRGALALTFGLAQLTMVAGPAVGGVVIGAFGVEWAYAADAVSCLGMALAAWAMRPYPPPAREQREPIVRSIRTGLRFVRGERAIMGALVIDLFAMTFGMPRALFPVLSLSVFGAGAAGTGALYAAVSAGATVAALTTGWLGSARRLGRIVMGAVTVWGAAVTLAGVMRALWPALVLFAVAGAADSVSAVCRNTIAQTLTPDSVRGRMSSVYSLVVASGPRLGDVEAGGVASLATPRFAVFSGGLACIAGVAITMLLFPELVAYDGHAEDERLAARRRAAGTAVG